MRKNDLSKNRHGLNRRQFIQTSARWRARRCSRVGADEWAGGRRNASHSNRHGPGDAGQDGLKLSRLGFGCGSNNGNTQVAAGKDAFTISSITLRSRHHLY